MDVLVRRRCDTAEAIAAARAKNEYGLDVKLLVVSDDVEELFSLFSPSFPAPVRLLYTHVTGGNPVTVCSSPIKTNSYRGLGSCTSFAPIFALEVRCNPGKSIPPVLTDKGLSLSSGSSEPTT